MIKALAGLILALLASLSPALAQQSVFVPATTVQIAVAGTVAVRTKIVSGIVGKSIYITALALVPVATSAVTLSVGTGTNCGTNTATLTGILTFTTGQVLTLGTGNGAILVVPSGFDLCITIATAAAPGALAYSQF